MKPGAASRPLFHTALPALLLVCSCGPRLAEKARIDPALARFIPPDAVAVGSVRVAEIRSSPVFQKFAPLLRDASGYDPQGVRELLLVSDGKHSVVAALGTVEGPDIRKLDRGTALAGSTESVEAAIAWSRNAARSQPEALLRRAGALAPDHQIWVVANQWTGRIPAYLPNAENFIRLFESVERGSFAADLRAGVKAVAEAECRDEAAAKRMGDTVRGLAGLARLSTPSGRGDILRLYDGLKITDAGRSLRVEAAISAEQIDSFLKR